MTRLRTTLALVVVLALGLPASAQADIRMGAVRSLDAREGAPSPRDRIVVFDDVGACADDAYAITIRWGDGTESAGRVTFSDAILDASGQALRCVYQASGSHTYRRSGTYPLSARVCRLSECRESADGGVARVADAELDGEAASLAAVSGQQFTARIGEFSDDNRLSQPSDYTVGVDWGDGSSSPATLIGEDGRFDVIGQHAYAAPGTYVLRMTLLEGGVPVAAADPGTVVVGAAPGAAAPAPAVAVPVLQTAASTSRTSFRPTMRIRTRSARRRALRRGIAVRLSLPATIRRLRMAIVRVGARPLTMGTVTVRIRGGRSVDGVRRVTVRVRLSRSLRRKLRPGTYAIQFRVRGSGLLSGQFRVRR